MKDESSLAETSSTTERSRLVEWVERVATFLADEFGLPPITGRVIGWLMICQPPEQSAGDIAEAIGASRASLTTTLRFLADSGRVRRLTRPGTRTTYYRIDDETWGQAIHRRITAILSVAQIFEDGMRLVGADDQRTKRLKSAHEHMKWLAGIFAESPLNRRRQGE
jgi:DNA-binding transcriptional regulator GbsR (MarR family)